MTSAELTTSEKTSDQSAEYRWQKISENGFAWLEQTVDRFNPIMVKETRQALKSRQFIITFFLVLIACWISSFAVVAIVGPEVYYVAEGPQMLIVYFAILAFPLMLIVPYSAFRSLAVEQEDNTYDLLSISALTTKQIVAGKLGSAVVQMLVYLSAISPCIAFTFLLRGVDVLTVGLLLIYYVLTSLGLSVLALFAGTIAKARYSQVILSVVLILAFAFAFFISIVFAEEFISSSYQFLREPEFWIASLAFLTFYFTSFALIHAAAAAQIAFHSENRSTPLRKIMIVQQACFLGWMAIVFQQIDWNDTSDLMVAILMVAGIYWYVMGAILTSEWPYLSRRVQRSLPQSSTGIAFLTWLNPGPGTGFMFSVANITFVALICSALSYATAYYTGNHVNLALEQLFLLSSWSYFVAFLGIGRLIIGEMRRFFYVSLTAGVLLHLILMLLAVGVPHILDYIANPQRFGVDYSFLHVTNPAWTLEQFIEQQFTDFELITLAISLTATAVVVLMLNIRTVWGEIQHQRRALPTRIVEEEAELHPEPEPKPQNPWEV